MPPFKLFNIFWCFLLGELVTVRASTLDALVQVGDGNYLGGADATETAGSDKSMMIRKEVMTLEAILMAADSTLEAKEEEFGKFQKTYANELNSDLSIDSIFDVVELVFFTAPVVLEQSKIERDEIEKATEGVIRSLPKTDDFLLR